MAATAATMERGRLKLGARWHKARYLARHNTLAYSLGLAARAWHSVLYKDLTRSPAAISAARRRLHALLRRDLQNVEDGVYPAALLSEFPLGDYLRRFPLGVQEFARIWWRRRRKAFGDLPAEVDLSAYPAYYLRTFHWQSDGWLSDRSAAMYDPGVEFLFAGTADVMRRMVLPPLLDAIATVHRPRVLDVACGTGRFLRQLHTAAPTARLYGLDMSPHYVRYAAEKLRGTPGVSLITDNAESMPLGDEVFDAVTCIFLFHELPKDVRRTVLGEIFRVLRPGGTFVICDSAQLGEAADIEPFLQEFPQIYHEPYFKSYLRDDLAHVAVECGFEVTATEPAFLSRIVVCRRPAPADRDP